MLRPSGRGAALAVLAACAVALGPRAAGSHVLRYVTGNPGDVRPPLFGPAYVLGGGAEDVDAALQWTIDAVRGCHAPCPVMLDVVVLRAVGSDGYNDYLYGMDGVDSVETLVIESRRDASSSEVEETVRRAEVVFFPGGDPCDYIRNFKGTRLEEAVKAVQAKGGGVGGTSAGLAIQGEVAYDACAGSIPSAEALADPYDRRVRFTYDLFRWPNVGATVMDSHFVARDRMGRAMVFVARQVQDGRSPAALALAVDERTSLVLDRRGRATVMGAGAAYFVLADHAPEVCRPGAALTYRDFKVWKRRPGESFDLARRPAQGDYTLSVTDGTVSGSPY